MSYGDVYPRRNLSVDSDPWGRVLEGMKRKHSRDLDNLKLIDTSANRSNAGTLGEVGQQMVDLTDQQNVLNSQQASLELQQELLTTQAGALTTEQGRLTTEQGRLTTEQGRLTNQTNELARQRTAFTKLANVAFPVVTLTNGVEVTSSGSIPFAIPQNGFVTGRRRSIQIYMQPTETHDPSSVASASVTITAWAGSSNRATALVPLNVSQPGDTPQLIQLYNDIPSNDVNVTINWTAKYIWYKQPSDTFNSIVMRGRLNEIYVSTSLGSP